MAPVLEIHNLQVSYFIDIGEVKAVNDVTLKIEKGEKYGLAGESGSGKSTLALAVMRLLRSPARIKSGTIYINGKNILTLPENELRKVRWKEVAIIFQGAMNALNPTHKVGRQIAEAILTHERVSRRVAINKAYELLALVGLDPQRAWSYPFQLSGGMKQRAMIAMALALNPSLLIADEPTTALDVVTGRRILALFRTLQSEFIFSLLLISHDLNLLLNFCDNIGIMYAGKLVEECVSKEMLATSKHPYTQALLKARFDLKHKEFSSIKGNPPSLINLPPGCPFHPRCGFVEDRCLENPPPVFEVSSGHRVRCWKLSTK